jgi:hypothetical protein
MDSLVWIAKKYAVCLRPSAEALLRTDDFSRNSVPIDPVLSAYRSRKPYPGEFPKHINLLYNPITGSCDRNQNPLPTRGTARLRGDADTNKFSGEMPRCSTCSQRSACSTRASGSRDLQKGAGIVVARARKTALESKARRQHRRRRRW